MSTVIGTDTFTDTDGVLLAAHTSDSGAAWLLHTSNANGFQIDTNRLRTKDAASTTSLAYLDVVPAHGDYDVEVDVVMAGDNNSSTLGPAGRIDPAANTAYFARYNCNGNFWELWKTVNGTATQIGSGYSQTLTAGVAYHCKLEMRGTALTVSVDGVARVTGTDNSIAAAGRAGLRGSGTAGAGVGLRVDNLTVTLADASGSIVDTSDRHLPRGVLRGIERGVI